MNSKSNFYYHTALIPTHNNIPLIPKTYKNKKIKKVNILFFDNLITECDLPKPHLLWNAGPYSPEESAKIDIEFLMSLYKNRGIDTLVYYNEDESDVSPDSIIIYRNNLKVLTPSLKFIDWYIP